MASNINTTRESRRRKILERGADRLALISGRSHSIPSQSEDKPVADSHLRCQDLPPHLSGQFTASPSGGDGEISCKLPTNNPVIDSGGRGNNMEPPLCTPETSIQTSTTPASDVRSNTPTSGSMQLLQQLCSNKLVTPSQISCAIAATESSRLLSSVTVAIFVVLSYLGFPLLSSNTVKSIICFRPFYLVLLTNLTLVLAKLLFSNQRGFNRIAGDTNISSTKYDRAEQAGKALEVGLLMKKAIDALVMDCSVYAIIVVVVFCIFH